MVRPGLRSRSAKRISKRVPGGYNKVFYIKRKHYRIVDPVTGKALNGVPKDVKIIRKGARTLKRPERAYGGVLSPKTLSTAFKIALRANM